MKNLMVVLVLLVVLNSLLMACSNNSTPNTTAPASTIKSTPTSDDGVDFSLLEDFVNGLNDQFVDATLNLFNEEATLTEIDQVALMSNLHQRGWNYVYEGKAEIKHWLKVEIEANAQIIPVEYKLYANYLSMDGILYYQDQALDFQLIGKPENGKITHLIYYIVKKKFT